MAIAPVIRLPLVALLALVVNAFLFWVIQYMVIDRQMRLTDVTDIQIANFVRMQEQSREIRSRRDPLAPQKPAAEMQQELSRFADASSSGNVGGLSVNLPEIDIGVDLGGNVQLTRELTPLVRIPPEYPERALYKGTEGYVRLRFTVTETGSVADPEVITSVPPGEFDRAAIRAVLRWKYQPQLVDGSPVSVVTTTRVRFALEKKDSSQ